MDTAFMPYSRDGFWVLISWENGDWSWGSHRPLRWSGIPGNLMGFHPVLVSVFMMQKPGGIFVFKPPFSTATGCGHSCGLVGWGVNKLGWSVPTGTFSSVPSLPGPLSLEGTWHHLPGGMPRGTHLLASDGRLPQLSAAGGRITKGESCGLL